MESVFMQLMWIKWTPLVIYVSVDILRRCCETSSELRSAIPSHMDRVNELRKRIAVALSDLQSRPRRMMQSVVSSAPFIFSFQ